MRYEAVVKKQLTKHTALYTVLMFREDANLGPCMVGYVDVVCGSPEQAIAYARGA